MKSIFSILFPPQKSYKDLLEEAATLTKTMKEEAYEFSSNLNCVFAPPITLKGKNGKMYTLNDILKSHNTLLKQNRELIVRIKELEGSLKEYEKY
jgi:hypothetical protein